MPVEVDVTFRVKFFLSSCLNQEMGLKVGQEASFAVQLNGARGLIDAKIHTPSGAIEECFITELDSGETRASVLAVKTVC